LSYFQLLDTSSLMYRAYFALPRSLRNNAVHGYLDMTTKLVRDYMIPHGPDAQIIHVYDHDWRPAARVAAYGGYKANRPDDPDGLPTQFELLRLVLNAFGIAQSEAPDWEADDAIGALCLEAPSGSEIEIVTGDRDLLQLVRDAPAADAMPSATSVRVLFTTKGVSELRHFDEAAVLEMYGVPAARYVDFAILRGDPSDGLPGIKGVGDKTARLLVQRYPTLDALLDDTDAQPARLAATLRGSRDYVEAMRAVVPIRDDVGLQNFTGPRDDGRLEELGTQHRLTGAIQRLREALVTWVG